jgi:hypothetical protein
MMRWPSSLGQSHRPDRDLFEPLGGPASINACAGRYNWILPKLINCLAGIHRSQLMKGCAVLLRGFVNEALV